MAFHRVQGRRALLGSAALVAATAPSLAAAPPSKGGVTARPPVAGAFSPSNYRKPTVGGPVTGVTFAPAVRQPSGANDLVGFNFNAGSRGALPAQQGGFGQVFAPGVLLASDRIEVERGGATYPAQLVPLATYVAGEPADAAHVGSVKHALVVTAFPALTANATAQAMLRKASSGPAGGNVAIAVGDLSAFAGTFAVVNRYAENSNAAMAVGTTVDVSPATMLGLAAPQVRFAGPLATEVRCIRELAGTGLRVLLDIRKHADGTVRLDYTWACDRALWANPSSDRSWTVAASLTQGGASVYNETWRASLGQTFRKVLRSGVAASVNVLADPPEHNVQHDMPYLAQTGAMPSVNFGHGMGASVIDGWASSADFMAAASWRKPNATNGLRKGLGGTGGRPDIGTIPGWHTAHLQTGDDRTRRIVVAQSEAAGAMPINFHDTTKDTQLSPFQDGGYGSFFFNDSQLSNPPANWTMPDGTSQWETNDTGWAHMPQFFLLAYLMTGDRFHADRLSNLGTATLFHLNYRGPDCNLMAAFQVRDRGWSIRSVAQSAGWLPDSNPLRPKFRTSLVNTFAYCNTNKAAWQASQGEPYGYLPDDLNNIGNHYVKWFMQDHVHAGVAEAVKLNVPGALETFVWLGNVRTKLAIQPGAVVQAGHAYELIMPTTWAGLAAQLAGYGWGAGNFIALWLRSLQDHAYLTGNQDAGASLAAIFATSPPPPAQYTSDAYYRTDPEGWGESRKAMVRV